MFCPLLGCILLFWWSLFPFCGGFAPREVKFYLFGPKGKTEDGNQDKAISQLKTSVYVTVNRKDRMKLRSSGETIVGGVVLKESPANNIEHFNCPGSISSEVEKSAETDEDLRTTTRERYLSVQGQFWIDLALRENS